MQNFLHQHNIDIMLLSETFLKPGTRLNIPNYQLYRNDRITQAGGGTAIFIKNTINHAELPTLDNISLEANGVKVQTSKGPLLVWASYCSPNSTLDPNDVRLFFPDRSATIMAGDLNAKHPDWNSKSRNTRGQHLKQMADQNNIVVIGPEDPTHIHSANNTTDVLDIALLKNVPFEHDTYTVLDMSSDHLPVILKIGTGTESDTYTKTNTNWNYLKTLKIPKVPIIRTVDELEQATTELENHLMQNLKTATTATTKQQKPPKLPQNLRDLIKEKQKAKKVYHRTLSPEHKTALNAATNRLKAALRDHANEGWQDKLTNISADPTLADIWKIAKSLRSTSNRNICPLKTATRYAVTDIEKANTFAQTLESQFRPNPPTNQNHSDKILAKFNSIIDDQNHVTSFIPVTPKEVQSIISKLPSKKAPGHDRITNHLLKNSHQTIYQYITAIANAVFRLHTFPSRWKTAIVIVIHKTGKPRHEPSSYRPISLLSSISKIIEKLIHTRLLNVLQQNQTIPNTQFGFRSAHSTIEQATRISTDIIDGFNSKKSTGMILFDVASAFDKVWHQALIVKLHRAQIPSTLILLINSYLTNRNFKVKINDTFSNIGLIQAGVPQGSVLGPTLFNLFMSDIPTPPHTHLAQYADDTALYCQSTHPRIITKYLQLGTDTLTEWFSKWQLQLNQNKTEAIFFTRRRNRQPQTSITIEKQIIRWSPCVKYLGIYLDSKLLLRTHIENTSKKARIILGSIYPLLHRNSTLTIRNKLRIYKALIRPILAYGHQIYRIAAPTHLRQIQRVQNKILRIITNSHWFVSNATIHRDLNTPTFLEYIDNLFRKNTIKMLTHHNPLISNSANYNPNTVQKYKKPRMIQLI